ATNLARPGAPHADEAPFPPADLAELVRLYGLRNWLEQGYKQLKQELGWADFMVRADHAIRRHWYLVFAAFSFCWRAWCAPTDPPPAPGASPAPQATAPTWAPNPAVAAGRGKNGASAARSVGPGGLAQDAASRPGLARSLDLPLALLAGVVDC